MDDFKGTTQQDLCQTIHRGKILLFQVVGLMDQSVSKGRNGFYPHFVKYLTNDIKLRIFPTFLMPSFQSFSPFSGGDLSSKLSRAWMSSPF